MREGPATLRATASLPVVRRGYAQPAVDSLVGELDARLAAVVNERDEVRTRVAHLEQQLAEADARKQAVADALVVASRVRAEREHQREEILAEARQQAEEILSVARTQARRMIEEAGERSSNLERELRAAGLLAERTRTHLARFVQSLRRDDDPGSSADDGPQAEEQPAAATTD